ncbi:hypothetical protein OH492_16975 [Vibrio chagasii]|nr:hypothetical protein [Vibrio chagasii]
MNTQANQEQNSSATSNITVKESWTGGGGLVDNPDRSISYLTSGG